MKHLKWILPLLVVLAAVTYFLRDIWIDLLPIDQSAWIQDDGRLCHIGPKGDRDYGWFHEDGNTFYLNPNQAGAITTGWQWIDSQRYHFDENGQLSTGILEDGGSRYFLSETGILQTGWIQWNGSTYYADEAGILQTGWISEDGSQYYLDAQGILQTGWVTIDGEERLLGKDGALLSGAVELDGKTIYLDANGCKATGWLEIPEGKIYLNPDSTLYTGWLEDNGFTYYLQEDGPAAVGKKVIDDTTHYFTSTGAEIQLLNAWNPLPKGAEAPELAVCSYGSRVSAEILEPLMRMLDDCKAAGCRPLVLSGYRSYWDQQSVLNSKANELGSYAAAYTIVAKPGTSEHHLGTAVDVTDSLNHALNRGQANNITQQWLMQHCWEYGFILRYPDNTSDYTGIIYEPWHYRYVGTELSLELQDLGICLEEYLDILTNDGTSCGGIDK